MENYNKKIEILKKKSKQKNYKKLQKIKPLKMGVLTSLKKKF